jgi:hypothetical protein
LALLTLEVQRLHIEPLPDNMPAAVNLRMFSRLIVLELEGVPIPILGGFSYLRPRLQVWAPLFAFRSVVVRCCVYHIIFLLHSGAIC